MARKLPVYLLLDTSGSMSGEPIEAVQNGLAMLRTALNNEPQALETVYISIITFNDHAQQDTPLTGLGQFQIPQLSAGGCTALGAALKLVSERAESEVAKNTPEAKGDWKPMVFLMTDGEPTDDISEGLAAFKKRKWGVVVACAAGMNANEKVLESITDTVVRLDTASSGEFKALFQWISQSVVSGSRSAGAGQELTSADQLEPPPPEVTIL
jgi:uncharacterized protein YegL